MKQFREPSQAISIPCYLFSQIFLLYMLLINSVLFKVLLYLVMLRCSSDTVGDILKKVRFVKHRHLRIMQLLLKECKFIFRVMIY